MSVPKTRLRRVGSGLGTNPTRTNPWTALTVMSTATIVSVVISLLVWVGMLVRFFFFFSNHLCVSLCLNIIVWFNFQGYPMYELVVDWVELVMHCFFV